MDIFYHNIHPNRNLGTSEENVFPEKSVFIVADGKTIPEIQCQLKRNLVFRNTGINGPGLTIKTKGNQTPVLFRVVHIKSAPAEHDPWVYYISIDGPNDKETPSRIPSEAFCRKLIAHELEQISEPFVFNDSPTEKMTNQQEFWLSLFNQKLLANDWIWNQKMYREDIRNMARLNNIDSAKLKRHATLYWRRGMDAHAFLADYRTQGKKDTSAISGIRSASQDTDHSEQEPVSEDIGKQLMDVDYENMRSILQTFFCTPEQPSLAETYRQLRLRFYTLGNDENGDVIFDTPQNTPSFAQFYYYTIAYASSSPDDVLRSRTSGTDFDLDMRPVLGKLDYNLPGPGMLVGIDATEMDLNLVDEVTRSNNIGRPTLTFLVDVCGRPITGFSLRLEHESFDSYRLALFCASSRKSSLFRPYGIMADDSSWPEPGIPAFILSDNGPLSYNISNQLTTELGIATETSVHYRADHKGFVECRFHIINLYLLPYLRGVIDANKKANGGKDSSDPCLTRKELLQIVVDFIEIYNRSHPISMSLTRGMLLDKDIQYSPLGLYQHGLLYRGSSVRAVDPYTVNVRLLPRKKGTLSRYGLTVKSLQYTCAWAIENGIFTRKHNLPGINANIRKSLTVYYDPPLTDTVFTYDAKTGETLIWTLKEEISSPFIGISFGEADMYLSLNKARLRIQKEKNEAARGGLTQRVQKIVKKAVRLTNRKKKERAGVSGIDKKTAVIEEIKATRNLDLHAIYGADPFLLIKEFLDVLDDYPELSAGKESSS